MAFLSRKDCGKVDDGPTKLDPGSSIAGFSLSNGVLSLNFDSNNKLVSWNKATDKRHSHLTTGGVPTSQLEMHPLHQTYLRYDEKLGITPGATDGSNVYTFEPITTHQQPTTLTPTVCI